MSSQPVLIIGNIQFYKKKIKMFDNWMPFFITQIKIFWKHQVESTA